MPRVNRILRRRSGVARAERKAPSTPTSWARPWWGRRSWTGGRITGGGDRAMQGHVTAHASQLAHALWPTVTAVPTCINRARKGRQRHLQLGAAAACRRNLVPCGTRECLGADLQRHPTEITVAEYLHR